MAVISVTLALTIPADPTVALVQAFCGKFGYQSSISTTSGMMPNPQSSGDFTKSTISGFCNQVISDYFRQQAIISGSSAAVSGVGYLLSSGFTFNGFVD